MAYYLVVKRGMKDSAAIFRSRKKAEIDGVKYYPDVPFTIKTITKEEALKRLEKYKKRLKGKVPQANIDRIRLPR